jgi:DNA-binding IclR family transcriptional regulator
VRKIQVRAPLRASVAGSASATGSATVPLSAIPNDGAIALDCPRRQRDKARSFRTQKRCDVAAPSRGEDMVVNNGTESAARVADVLLAFTDDAQSLGVSRLASELGLSKAVVHRILQTLVDKGLVVADPSTRGYGLGPAAAAFGARALRGSQLRRVAMPVLYELQRASGETSTVSALVPGGRVYLDQVESAREIKMTVELGRRFPLHAGSSSTCILAFLSPTLQESVFADDLEPLTAKTIVAQRSLKAKLADIRRNGYAFSEGERQEGAASCAAPIFRFDGSVTGAVSVCGPVNRFDTAARQRLVPRLTEAADRVSRALGWRGGLPDVPGEPA